MNKFYLGLLCITFAYFVHADDNQEPTFEESINLFKERNLFEQLKIQEELEKVEPKLSQKQIDLLKSLFTAKKIHEATGRQVPEVGYDDGRKVTHTDTPTKPTHIVLTFSGQETLQDTKASLERHRVAHNFIIGLDGKIYPVTKEGENLEDALSHRPFAVGFSGKVIEGKYEERDMNSVSITISVVGKDDKPATQEQEEALAKVISWLSQKFEIQPYNVVDYGTVALPYGRRNTQENLPWQNLAKKGLTIWPTTPSMTEEEANKPVATYPLILSEISCAFRKIGFLCPIVRNHEQEDFKDVVKTFQKHYKCSKQDGTLTQETVKKLFNIVHQLDSIYPKFKDIYPSSKKTN
jgi:N-acetyl-anhydromuramyl-L-alanine amidase AmpD